MEWFFPFWKQPLPRLLFTIVSILEIVVFVFHCLKEASCRHPRCRPIGGKASVLNPIPPNDHLCQDLYDEEYLVAAVFGSALRYREYSFVITQQLVQ